MVKTTRFLTALFTVSIFLAKELFAGVPFSWPQSSSREPYTALNKPALALPARFGTIDSFKPGKGPLLIHLQTAHGDYEAQKNIQATLHYLKNNYGIKLILVEGSAFKLEPEILRFFPDQINLTMKIADALAKKALVKGVELFLLENPGSEAYGIENIEAYRANREAFRAVLNQREKAEAFLASLESRLQDLRGFYFNKELNLFFKQWEENQKGHSLPQAGFNRLETEAKRHLGIDFSDPAFQIDWPMLVRFSTLKELEKEMNRETFEKERRLFLAKIRPFIKRGQARSDAPVPFLFEEIEKLLALLPVRDSLPDPETGLLVEAMVKSLPAHFDFNAYRHVRRFLGMLILRSELKGERLIQEIDRLQDRIFEKLARTREEKNILELFRRYELLRKLFTLELSPEDYRKVLQEAKGLYPEALAQSLFETGKNKRKSRLAGADMAPMNILFAEALKFYLGVKKRDQLMISNIEKQFHASGEDVAVVISGGFHAQPLKKHFETKEYGFAAISPKTGFAQTSEARVLYQYSILEDGLKPIRSSTLESRFLIDRYGDFYSGNQEWLDRQVRETARPVIGGEGYDSTRIPEMLDVISEHLKEPEMPGSAFRSEVRNEGNKKDEGKDAKIDYQSIVESFSNKYIYFFRKDLEGRFTYVSDSFARLVGRPAAEIIGRMDFELFPPRLAHKYRINDRWVTDNDKNFEDEEEFESPEGKKTIVKILKVPVKDAAGNIVGVQGMFWDITKQVMAKRRIAGHLRRALDAANMGTWEWETKSNAFRWSKNVKSLFNLSRRQVNTFEHFIEFVHPKDRERVSNAVLGVLRGGYNDFYVEYRIVLADEKERWFAQQGKAIRRKNGKGTTVRIAGTLEDITERKQSQLKLRETEDKLKQAEIQAEQQKALAEMEAKLRNVIGAIAHIFNNKLTSVLGFTDMAVTMQLPQLKKELEILQDQLSRFGGHYLLPVSAVDEVIAFLANPLKEAHKMKLLIEDLMIYADIHLTHRQLVELDVRTALKAAFSDIKKELGIKEMPLSVRIEELYDPILPKVKADMEWLSRALMKVISNGIEAVQEKGGALTITTGRGLLMDQVEIIIEDTGPGIDEESVKKRKIFDPFYTTKFLGRGLGLPVALRLIEKMGGEIHVESALGKGTKFRILLPLNGTEARSEIRTKGENSQNKKIENRETGWIKNKFKTLIAVAGVALIAGGASLALDLHEKAIHVIELFGERTTAALVHGAIAGLIFYIFRLYRKAQKEIKLRVQLEEDILKSTEVIRESDAIQRTVINTVDERIFFKDYKHKNAEGETGFFVQVNLPFAHDFGFEPDELKGKTDYVLLKPRDPDAKKAEVEASIKLADTFRANDMKVMRERQTITWKEKNILLINGKPEERILETTKKPVIDDETDEAIGVLGTYKDITEREKQEQQLRESKSLLQGILDALPFVILERDAALKPQYANARAALFFGFDSPADPFQAQGVFAENPEFSEKYQKENERIIKSGEAIEEDEEIVIAGRRKIFHKIKHPLFGPESEIFGLVEIFQDVTEEREMSERLTHAEVLEANDQFAKELAHDVRNLLTGVLGNIEEASTLLQKGLSAQEEMDQIKTDVHRVAEMVTQFGNQSRAGAETLTMLKLAPVVTQAVRSAKARFSSIEFKPPVALKTLPYIMGNAQQILRAVSNVLWNAAETIEATSQQGGVITVTLDRVRLEQPVGIIHSRENFRSGTYIEVAVNNTGPAISEDVLARMVKVLQEKNRDDFTTKPTGSGKGLPVVRNAVLQNHEGMIDIRTNPEKGTTVHLYFFAPNGGPKPANIWIIHDIFKIQQGILHQLKEDKENKYEALPFNNIQAAIDYARDSSQLPELIIYKEEDKTKIPATLTILKQEVPGKSAGEIRGVAVPKALYAGGSWPKRPNTELEEFYKHIRKELDSRKKSSALLPVGEVRREIEKVTGAKKLNILIVDDEDGVAKLLTRISEAFAANLKRVQNGTEAVAEIERAMYHVVFLDLNFVGGTPEEVVLKIRGKWGRETKIIMSSGSIPEGNSELLDAFDARLPKPFRPVDVQNLLGEIEKDLRGDNEDIKRSEMRAMSLKESLASIPEAVRIVIREYREDILPIRFEAYGPEFLAGLLRELLGRPVYAEKAGMVRRESKPLLSEGRIIMTDRYQSWLKQIIEAPSLNQAGRAIFDSAWLDIFLENPRSLYLLLKSFNPFEGKGGEPFIAFVGDADLIKHKIRLALERQNNSVIAEEKIEIKAFFEDFERLVKILSPEQVAAYVQGHENGVAILRANQSLMSQIPSAAHFILDPNTIASRDVPVVALTAPALLKAAQLIRGVPPSEQIKVLRAHMKDIFPGAAQQGDAFVISFASYLTETLQKNQYIATQA